jgi:hypothetical protein
MQNPSVELIKNYSKNLLKRLIMASRMPRPTCNVKQVKYDPPNLGLDYDSSVEGHYPIKRKAGLAMTDNIQVQNFRPSYK